MATRKPKILTSPAKGAKRTAKQWAGAFRAVKETPHLFDVMTKGRREANARDDANATVVMRGTLATDATRTLAERLSDYCVRQGTDEQWGIYLREYNVRVATFSRNSHPIREVLTRAFNAAAKTAEKLERLRDGWRTCGCGQFVHDKLAPCSVCKPKRRRK